MAYVTWPLQENGVVFFPEKHGPARFFWVYRGRERSVMRGRIRPCCIAASLAFLASVAFADAQSTAPVPFQARAFAAPVGTDQYLTGQPFSIQGAEPFGTASISGSFDAPIKLTLDGGPPAAPRFDDLHDVVANVPLSPAVSLELGHGLDSAAAFTGVDGANNGLFLANSALGANYAPFGNADYVGASLKLSPVVSLHAGEATSSLDRNGANENAFATLTRPVDALVNFGERTADTLMAGVTLKATDWAGIDFTASHSSEKFSLADAAPVTSLSSDAINVSAELKFGSGWVTTASYGRSLSKLDIKPSALALSSVDLQRSGYAVSIAKHGIFGDDALGLSVARPADPEIGPSAFATVVSPTAQPVFIGPDHLLGDQKSETDIELGYTTSFSDSFALQTNAAYEMNFQGQNGTNALEFVSRAKIKF